jgi:hypothetical protein
LLEFVAAVIGRDAKASRRRRPQRDALAGKQS